MFRSVRLGTFLGIPVTAHWSLPLLAAWLVTSAYLHRSGEEAAMTAMIIVGAFASILAHEYGHVLVARFFGIGTQSINLSPLGGIAFLNGYPEKPGQRALVALGGPAVSLVLATAFGAWTFFMLQSGEVQTPVGTLFAINAMILLFNLLPIYPMDGGQVLNAAALKIGGKAFAQAVSLWTGQAGTILLLIAGVWLSSISLALISIFLFCVVALEFESPVLRLVGLKPGWRDGKGGESKTAAHNGMFVAFDSEGRHFAYARHWLDCPGDEEDQKATVTAYALKAMELGGEMRLLSQQEFRDEVLAERAVA